MLIGGTLETRWMVKRDLTAVVSIEEQLFGGNAWSTGDFLRYLRGRTTVGRVAIWTEDDTDTVLGYVLFELVDDGVLIENLGVLESVQRCGIGTRLLGRELRKLGPHRQMLLTYVSERNLAAQLFFKSQGLVCDSIVTNYWGDDTAYRFVYRYVWQEAVA